MIPLCCREQHDMTDATAGTPSWALPVLLSHRSSGQDSRRTRGVLLFPHSSSRVAPAERGKDSTLAAWVREKLHHIRPMRIRERSAVQPMTACPESKCRDLRSGSKNAPSKARRELVDWLASGRDGEPGCVAESGYPYSLWWATNAHGQSARNQCPAQTRPHGAWPRDPAPTHGYQRHPEMGTGWRSPNRGALWGRRPTLGRLRRLPSVAHISQCA